jgi:hypothetical protein
MTAVLERDIERYLVKRVKDAGGEVRKTRWIGRRGAPDRRVMLKGGHWVELKAPGETLRPEQVREHERMARRGDPVHTLDTFQLVDHFMEEITR